MSQAPASGLKLVRIAESVLIGAVGGFLFNAAKFPAGWLAGSMVFAAAAALAGRSIRLPRSLARACSVVLGITMGGTVTPETLGGMMTWPLSIAMVSISVAAATLATYTYLTRVHGWNGLTAMFASIPGGLAQVMALAAERGEGNVGDLVVGGGRGGTGFSNGRHGNAELFDSFEEGGDLVGQLRTLANPLLHASDVQLKALVLARSYRIVETDLLDAAAVALAALIGHNDVVERTALGAAARKTNLDHSKNSRVPAHPASAP